MARGLSSGPLCDAVPTDPRAGNAERMPPMGSESRARNLFVHVPGVEVLLLLAEPTAGFLPRS